MLNNIKKTNPPNKKTYCPLDNKAIEVIAQINKNNTTILKFNRFSKNISIHKKYPNISENPIPSNQDTSAFNGNTKIVFGTTPLI